MLHGFLSMAGIFPQAAETLSFAGAVMRKDFASGSK
jgi:hypothetical protein